MARFFKLLIIVPIAILILAFAVANRQIVSVSFDPFADPERSTAVVAAPLFVLMFLVLIVGTMLGGLATWITQGVSRRRARQASDEAEHWRDEVRRMREQPPLVMSDSRALARPAR